MKKYLKKKWDIHSKNEQYTITEQRIVEKCQVTNRLIIGLLLCVFHMDFEVSKFKI